MDKSMYKGIPLESSLLNFDKYIVHSQDNKEQLYSLIKDCQVDSLKIRCDVWRLTLDIINVDLNFEQKSSQLQKERDRYHQLLQKYSKKQHIQQTLLSQNPLLVKNPLGKLLIAKPVAVTPTKEELDDDFLENQIRKDVERTYQQRQFFHNTQIIRILSRVLFIWSKQFPDISYQQGMNEVGASIIWVYFQSTVDPKTIHLDHQGIVEELQQKYLFFHSNEHAQADIYSLFDHMMNSGHKQMFRAENQNNKQINPNSKNNSPILQRIIKLSDIKFKIIDGQLFRHMKLNQVAMRPFLLKWIRCIHTRQFELEESFPLWDNIFLAYHAEHNQGLYLIDCTILAMLVYLRDIALKKDARFEIVQLYQKYPKIKGKQLQQVVNLAWTIKAHLQTSQKQNDKKKELQFTQNIIGQFKVYNSQQYATQKNKTQLIQKQQKQQRAQANNIAKQKQNAPSQNVEKKSSNPPQQKQIIKVQSKESNESNGNIELQKSSQQVKQQKEIQSKQSQKQKQPHSNPLHIPPRKVSQKTQQKKIAPKPAAEKPKQPPKVVPVQPPPPPVKQINYNITFNHSEWKQIQSLMKKSIEQNTDLQSRSLTLKVMKIFSNKEQQQIKRLQSQDSS